MMSRNVKKSGIAWWLMVLGALAALAFVGRAAASKRVGEMTVGHVCVAGMAVPVAGSAAGVGKEAGGTGEVERCRLPMVPAGLPGEHLLSAAAGDGRSGVVLARTRESPKEAMGRVTRWLSEAGWRERPASREARSRSAGLPLAVHERPGGRLYVATMHDPKGDGGLVFVAGLPGGSEVGR